MQMNDHNKNTLHVHYSPKYDISVGYKAMYMRDTEAQIHGVQMNNLLARNNTKESQANLYIKSGVGVAEDDGSTRPVGWTGIAGDWETRRYFTSYENNVTYANDIEESFSQKARVGIAPYVGGYGDLHTWLMLQVEHHPGDKDENFVVTPLVRMFKGPYLGEVGVSHKGDALFNWVVRF